jgi:outer membrane protein, heavy metal efflux system
MRKMNLQHSFGAVALRVLGLIVVATLPAMAQTIDNAVDSVSEAQMVAQVVATNDRLAAAKYMEESARAKIGSAGAWDDPMLMLGFQNLPTTWNFTADGMTMKMVGLSWNIPYSGAKGLEHKAAESQAAASGSDREMQQRALIFAARSAYADLYFRTQALTALAAQYELMTQVVATVRSRLTVNQSGQEEFLAAQSELWKLQSDLLMAEADMDNVRFDLNALRGAPIERRIVTTAPPSLETIPQSADTLVSAARLSYPPLRRLAAQSQSYAFARDASKRMRLPMINLSGYYGFRSGIDAPSMDGMPGGPRLNMIGMQATFSLPFFAGRKQNDMARSMDAMRQSSDAEYRQLERETESTVRTLHLYAFHGQQSVALYRDRIVPASQDAFTGSMSGYEANRIPLATVLNYALTLYRNKLTMLQLNSQLARTLAELSQYTEDPTAAPSTETKTGSN